MVLVVLVIANIEVVIYFVNKLNRIENLLEFHHNKINHHITQETEDSIIRHEQIINTFDEQLKSIKQIPKEITVKNVLNLP